MRFIEQDVSNYLKTRNSRGLGKKLMIELFNEVFPIIFENNSKFSFKKFDVNDKVGVIEKINGVDRWSWLNSLNTNYSSLTYLFNHFVTLGYKFKQNPFNFSNCHNTLRIFKNALIEQGKKIFLPGNEIIKDLYFIVQNTWITGLISVLNTYIILQNHNIIFDFEELNFERGNTNDFNGIDYNIQIDGVNYRTQHKKTSLRVENGNYIVPFIDSTYINNIDVFIIDDNINLYILKNENINIDNKSTIFKKENLIMEIIKDEVEVSKLMNQIFVKTHLKKIVFEMNKNTDKTNSFIQNEKMVILNIGDPMDINLPEKLKEILSKL